MRRSDLEEAFLDYYETVSLSKTQQARLDAALATFVGFAQTAYPDANIFTQGSVATDTLVKPLTSFQSNGKPGSYDADIAIEDTSWSEDGAVALNDLNSMVCSDPDYNELEIENKKNSCVTINYDEDDTGVGFHLDLVPTRAEGENREVADREKHSWKDSDSKRFADEFNSIAEKYDRVRSVVVILKRLRDRMGYNDELKSILLLTLVVGGYYPSSDLVADVLGALKRADEILRDGEIPEVINPVNPGENLCDRLTKEEIERVREFYKFAAEEMGTALANQDGKALIELFGSELKVESFKPLGAALATASVKPVRAYGIEDGSDCR